MPRFSPPLVAAGVLYTATGVACTQLPLLNTLGFESSFVIGVLTAVAAGPLAVHLFRRGPSAPFAAGVTRVLRSLYLLTAIPLVLLLLNMLRVENCAPLEGMLFYILLPGVSVPVAAALGIAAAVYFRRAVPAYAAAVFLLVAEGIITGYTTPAVYSYNLLYGYFPGLTHDEAIGIPSALPLYRLWSALVAGMLFGVAAPGHDAGPAGTPGRFRFLRARLWTPRTRVIAGTCLLFLGVTGWFRCELGFVSTAPYVRERLGGVLQTEHFFIYYDRATFSKREIGKLAHLHEFALHRVLSRFELRTAGPFESYLYGSEKQRLTLVGAGETSISQPWSGQMHLVRTTAGEVLVHELSHLVAARFGVPVLAISLSPALLEGLAMAVEWDWGNRTLHEYSAAMLQLGAEEDPGSVLTMSGFFSRKPSASYVLAGSFCRYLIDRYGMRGMVRVYGDGEFEQAFGRSRKTLLGEWQAYLDQITVPPQDSAVVDVFFRSPPIFGKRCPRETARLRREAVAALAVREDQRARMLFARAAESGDVGSLRGLLAADMRLGNHASVLLVLDSILAADARPARFLPLYLSGGDASWALGDTGKAAAFYRAVLEADYAAEATEAAALRLCAMQDPVFAVSFLQYTVRAGRDTSRGKLLDSVLVIDHRNRCALLLSALERLRTGDAEGAARNAGSFRTSDPLLESIRLRIHARALFETGRYQEAKGRMWESMTYRSNRAMTARSETWIELCDWMSTHGR